MSEMSASCRVCGESITGAPILSYSNMPGSAQGFLSKSEIVNDHGDDLELYQCSACGVVQLTSEPVPYYREVIRAAAYSPEMQTFRQEQFADWSNRYQLSGCRVIEAGCGRGEYMELLRSAGMDVYGVEYSKHSVQACDKAGLNVIQGYFSRNSRELPIAPFDAFLSFNFLEHWPDPIGSLQAIATNLADGAVGLVEVPNFDMVLQKGLFSEFIADHLLYFTEETLRFTLQRSGFEVLSCRAIWHDYILSAEVKKRPLLDISPLELKRDVITEQLHQYLSRFPPGQVAVWGAGHQALAVISLAGIAQDLRYIVDSAPFKQGKFTPASHIRIVHPDTLNSEPVEAVIVMAASYSGEVADILRNDYGHLLDVVILRDDRLEVA